MAKPHRCDVPGCPNTRRRWQRICEQCFTDLSAQTRTGIIENYRLGNRPQWKQFRKIAEREIAQIKARRLARANAPALVSDTARPTACEAYARTQRQMGERD